MIYRAKQTIAPEHSVRENYALVATAFNNKTASLLAQHGLKVYTCVAVCLICKISDRHACQRLVSTSFSFGVIIIMIIFKHGVHVTEVLFDGALYKIKYNMQ